MSQPSNVRVLLVDDSKSVTTHLAQSLGGFSMTVDSFLHAREALAALEQNEYDCILSDYEMPEINGADFSKKVKSDERWKYIPLLILTAKDAGNYLQPALEAGADDFVSKSVSTEILVTKIRALIRFRKMRDELNQLKRLEGISQTVATYNHEINNPLAIALGHLLFLEKTELSEECQGRLKKMRDSLERIQTLMKKLREATRFEPQDYSKRTQTLKAS